MNIRIKTSNYCRDSKFFVEVKKNINKYLPKDSNNWSNSYGVKIKKSVAPNLPEDNLSIS